MESSSSSQIEGVIVRSQESHSDERGVFTEIYREHWGDGDHPLQWNVVRSNSNVLRGVHVHKNHADYLTLVEGQALFVLYDMRNGSPSEGLISYHECSGESLVSLYIPPGVAHGFYFYTPSIHVYSVSEYFDPSDELGFRYDDPALKIKWPSDDPMISTRDRDLPAMSSVVDKIPAWEKLAS